MAFFRGGSLLLAPLSLAVCILHVKCDISVTDKTHRVAIIGSGIGGASSARFVRQLLGPSAHITVFERSNLIGGRLATITSEGESYEAGGSIIHPDNLYMKTFAQELNLEILEDSASHFSVYDGDKLVFDSGTWLTSLKLLWRYGLSLFKMASMTEDYLNRFKSIYTMQDKGQSFKTVSDMLNAMGGVDYYNLTQVSLEKHLQDKGISQILIDELVTGVMRNNYGQSSKLNAFTGMVSLAGAHPGLWAVKGGNKKICEGLIEKSASSFNKDVHIIEIIKKEQSEDRRPVYFLRSTETLLNTPYDAVIVAVPLAITHNFIGCQSCKWWPKIDELGNYHTTITTFIRGDINKAHFNTQVLENIFTMEQQNIAFNSIGLETSVTGKKSDQNKRPLWKVFSRKPLVKEMVDKFFLDAEIVDEIYWLAYPHYNPPERFTPFILDDGVFYVNAIETAASAMEMSALSARNAALLLADYLHLEKTQPETSTTHTEL